MESYFIYSSIPTTFFFLWENIQGIKKKKIGSTLHDNSPHPTLLQSSGFCKLLEYKNERILMLFYFHIINLFYD